MLGSATDRASLPLSTIPAPSQEEKPPGEGEPDQKHEGQESRDARGERLSWPRGFLVGSGPGPPQGSKGGLHSARGHLTLCLVFCRLLRRIFRISSSLSLDRAGRMRSTGRVLGLMFLRGQTGFRVTLR